MGPYDTGTNLDLSTSHHKSVSRTPQQSRSRQKACLSCARSKARCSLRRPACDRCRTRGSDCVYAQDEGMPAPPLQDQSYSGEIAGDAFSGDEARRVGNSSIHVDADADAIGDVGARAPRTSLNFDLQSTSMLGLGSTSTSTHINNLQSHLSPITNPSSLDDISGTLPNPSLPSNEYTTSIPVPTPSPKIAFPPCGRISLRWLNAFSPAQPPPRPKYLSNSTIYFCSRYLRTFPSRLLSRDNPLPFIHPSQLESQPGKFLANLITLVRMFSTREKGSEELVYQTICNEMKYIMTTVRTPPSDCSLIITGGLAWSYSSELICDLQCESLNGSASLAAFQSYLVLCILAYFHFSDAPDPHIISIETFLHLQILADRASQMVNIICVTDEKHHPSLSFDEYTYAEAFRRTIYATCVFEDVWNSSMGLPTFVAEDLGRLPAPSSRYLWNANQTTWSEVWREYVRTWLPLSSSHDTGSGPVSNADTPNESNTFVLSDTNLADRRQRMEEPGLRMSELWISGAGSDPRTDARVDQWITEVDEFGMWIFGICEMAGSGRGNGTL
jgi:hypothetical protein